jgi:hypothetical protein
MSLRRLLPASLFASAVALGGSTLGYPAIASAVWDVEKYDACVADYQLEHPDLSLGALLIVEEACCEHSGGRWSPSQHACVASFEVVPERNRAPIKPPTDLPTESAIVPTLPVEAPTIGIG